MLGPKIENTIEDGSHNQQAQIINNHGVPVADFIAEMRRKDDRIDELLAEKEALRDQDHSGAREREKLEAEIADLRIQKAGLEARLADPAAAYADHRQRESQLEQLLADAATEQAIGGNRIRAALDGFKELEYAEVDALFQETERRGILLAANAAYGQGLIAEDAVKWQDAYRHYKRAAQLSDALAHIRAQARLSWRLHYTAEGIPLHERLCAAAKSEHGETSAEYATDLNNLASLIRAQGRYPEAEGLYRQALEIDRATIGEGHPGYATHLNNLAGVVRAQGRYPEAEGLYRQALEIDRATIGEGHPEYATDLNNLAGVVRAQGRYPEAEGLYRQALEIDRATIGEGHPDYATRLNNLAWVVQAQGRNPEAEGFYAGAMAILRQTLGDGHPNTRAGAANFLDLITSHLPDSPHRAEMEALLAGSGEASPNP